MFSDILVCMDRGRGGVTEVLEPKIPSFKTNIFEQLVSQKRWNSGRSYSRLDHLEAHRRRLKLINSIFQFKVV